MTSKERREPVSTTRYTNNLPLSGGGETLSGDAALRPEARHVRERCAGEHALTIMDRLEADGWDVKLSSFEREGVRVYRARVHREGGRFMGEKREAPTREEALEQAWVAGLLAEQRRKRQWARRHPKGNA